MIAVEPIAAGFQVTRSEPAWTNRRPQEGVWSAGRRQQRASDESRRFHVLLARRIVAA